MIRIMLPVYNAARTLPSTLDAIREVTRAGDEPYTAVVIDDGSTDATVSVCRSWWNSMPLEVSCHVSRRGLGQAMMTGLKYCLSRCDSKDVVVCMQADAQHPPALMPLLVRRIRAGSDVAIASRYAPGGTEIGLPAGAKVLTRCSRAVLRAAFRIPGVSDYTCGYRAYSASILERGFAAYADDLISEAGSACAPELLVKLAKLGARVSETPLVVRYDGQAVLAENPIGAYLRLMTVNRPKPLSSPTLADIGSLGGSLTSEEEEG